ncbi:MAG TPA: hypothetical protein VIV34_12835 [Pseudolabrys sp.]
MQRAITIAAVVVLILAGVAIKAMVAPSETVAGTHDINGPAQSAMSIYDLHVAHPDMKTMPVQQAPLP